jgi:hypothetical protein
MIKEVYFWELQTCKFEGLNTILSPGFLKEESVPLGQTHAVASNASSLSTLKRILHASAAATRCTHASTLLQANSSARSLF